MIDVKLMICCCSTLLRRVRNAGTEGRICLRIQVQIVFVMPRPQLGGKGEGKRGFVWRLVVITPL